MTDITSLTGNDLWSALTSGKPVTIKPKAELTKLFPTYTPLPNPWLDEALILLTFHTTCQSCGSLWEQPNPLLLLERVRPKDNAHHFQEVHALANILARCSGLPRRLKIREQTVPFCQSCFNTLPDETLLQPQLETKQEQSDQKDRLALIRKASAKINS